MQKKPLSNQGLPLLSCPCTYYVAYPSTVLSICHICTSLGDNIVVDALFNFGLFSSSPGLARAHYITYSEAFDNHQARSGISNLDIFVHLLIDRGVVNSMQRSCTSGKNRYLEFCSHCHCRPLPVSDMILLHFLHQRASHTKWLGCIQVKYAIYKYSTRPIYYSISSS